MRREVPQADEAVRLSAAHRLSAAKERCLRRIGTPRRTATRAMQTRRGSRRMGYVAVVAGIGIRGETAPTPSLPNAAS